MVARKSTIKSIIRCAPDYALEVADGETVADKLDVFVLFLCCEGSGDIACGGNDGVAGNFNCFARFIGADTKK